MYCISSQPINSFFIFEGKNELKSTRIKNNVHSINLNSTTFKFCTNLFKIILFRAYKYYRSVYF